MMITARIKVFGQIEFPNPSLEGIPGNGNTPFNWDTCNGYATCVCPFVFAVPIYQKKAIDGLAYGYLFGDNSNVNEILLSTRLNCPILANYHHSSEVYLFTLYDDFTNPSYPGVLKIYGGNSTCSLHELLWTSPLLDTFWTKYRIDFTPKENYQFITLVTKPGIMNRSDLCSNTFVDGFSPIYIENLSEISATASATEIKAGEAVQLQSILNSNLIQPPYSITWHSSFKNFNSMEQNPGVVMPIITTTYYVELKDSCGYKAWDSVVVHVNTGGKVYYDFTNQKIKVVFGSDEATENYQLTLYNTLGQRIATETLPVNIHEYEYSTAGLPNAMYFVSVRSKEGKVFGGKVEILN
jgi:hypothetical protein